MSGFDFSMLDLSTVNIPTGGSVLKPGKYVVRVKDAELQSTKSNDGSKRLWLELEDIDGAGSIQGGLNIVNRTAKAQEIGRENLKGLCFFGGHPNPNRPTDVKLLRGLVVGVIIKETKYTKDGQEKNGSEIAKFIDPYDVSPDRFVKKVVPEPVVAGPVAPGSLDDEIPF